MYLCHFRTLKSLSKCGGLLLDAGCFVALEVQEDTSTGHRSESFSGYNDSIQIQKNNTTVKSVCMYLI